MGAAVGAGLGISGIVSAVQTHENTKAMQANTAAMTQPSTPISQFTTQIVPEPQKNTQPTLSTPAVVSTSTAAPIAQKSIKRKKSKKRKKKHGVSKRRKRKSRRSRRRTRRGGRR